MDAEPAAGDDVFDGTLLLPNCGVPLPPVGVLVPLCGLDPLGGKIPLCGLDPFGGKLPLDGRVLGVVVLGGVPDMVLLLFLLNLDPFGGRIPLAGLEVPVAWLVVPLVGVLLSCLLIRPRLLIGGSLALKRGLMLSSS